MSMSTLGPGADPTRLVLWAASRLAYEFDLPEQASVRSLLGTVPRDGLTVTMLVVWYATRALDELADSDLSRLADHDVAVVMARRVARASAIAAPIQHNAQAGQTAATDADVWDLLVMIVTLVYVRLEERNDLARLVERVTDVAVEIENITSEGT